MLEKSIFFPNSLSFTIYTRESSDIHNSYVVQYYVVQYYVVQYYNWYAVQVKFYSFSRFCLTEKLRSFITYLEVKKSRFSSLSKHTSSSEEGKLFQLY